MYGLSVLLESLLYANFFQDTPTAKKVIIAVYFASAMTSYFMLFFNSFVGYRWLDDGRWASLLVNKVLLESSFHHCLPPFL